jgi:PAS domain S-box-containing protein
VAPVTDVAWQRVDLLTTSREVLMRRGVAGVLGRVIAGVVVALAAYGAVGLAHPEQVAVVFLLSVAVATLLDTTSGIAAALAATAFNVAAEASPDIVDAMLFLLVAVSLPSLAGRWRHDVAGLHRSERRFRDLVEKLPVALYLDAPDPSAASFYTNPAMVELLGYPAERWQEPGFFGSILHPDDRRWVLESLQQLDDEPFEDTYRVRANDGSYRWILDRGALVRDASGRPSHVQGVVLDVTAQKEAEAAALVASRRYQSLVENLPLVTYVEDARETGTTVYISPQVEELLGYPAERWLATKDFFFQVLDPAFHERIRATRGDQRTTQEFRLFAADGSERWIHSERTTVYGATGEPMLVQGVWVDLTEHRQLEQRVAQQDRLDAVGQLAAGVAHNFNNMLVAIRGYAELAAMRPTVDEARSDLAIITDSVDRAAELIRHLLAFSRRQQVEPKPTNVYAVIDELLPILRQLLGPHIDLEFDAKTHMATATIDRAGIEQALINLATNARDAMDGGGTLTVTLAELPSEADDAGVLISVGDTGTGLATANPGRIFDPFFTTKESGTGLGLSTAYGSISQLGGELRLAHTAPGEGTIFEIFLPATPAGELSPAASMSLV